jgi:hypothetical protein
MVRKKEYADDAGLFHDGLSAFLDIAKIYRGFGKTDDQVDFLFFDGRYKQVFVTNSVAVAEMGTPMPFGDVRVLAVTQSKETKRVLSTDQYPVYLVENIQKTLRSVSVPNAASDIEITEEGLRIKKNLYRFIGTHLYGIKEQRYLKYVRNFYRQRDSKHADWYKTKACRDLAADWSFVKDAGKTRELKVDLYPVLKKADVLPPKDYKSVTVPCSELLPIISLREISEIGFWQSRWDRRDHQGYKFNEIDAVVFTGNRFRFAVTADLTLV